jgi:hypothetical protein
MLPLAGGACRPSSPAPGASAAPADEQATSRPASAPRILSQPQSVAVREGDPIMLKVVADAIPAPTYQWMHDGSVIPSATAATLQVPSARASDAGAYRVTVSNDAGSVVSEPAAVAVQAVSAAPSITGLPPDLLIVEGAASVLRVDANGTGPFTYVWTKEGQPASLSTEAAFWLQTRGRRTAASTGWRCRTRLAEPPRHAGSRWPRASRSPEPAGSAAPCTLHGGRSVGVIMEPYWSHYARHALHQVRP